MTEAVLSKSRAVAECCFVDVGQGTCNVVLLGDNRAIVIDCGPRGFTPIRLLEHYGVTTIAALVVSHNDQDHCGGAGQILEKYPKAIRKIFFLDDRPARENRFLAMVRREKQAGNLLNEPMRLEASYSCVIHDEPDKKLSLHVLFPPMLANIAAREAKRPNETSGLLALQCGKRRVVFAGDLGYFQWQEVVKSSGVPLGCDVLAVPHHGGALSKSDHSSRQAWLYNNGMKCDVGVISVGTWNRDHHPRPDHVAALRRSGTTVLCTQITQHCCGEDELETLRPGVIAPTLPGESRPTLTCTSSARRSKHVGCAGTVIVEIGPDHVLVQRLNEHQAAVRRLAQQPYGHPLCCLPSDRTGAPPF